MVGEAPQRGDAGVEDLAAEPIPAQHVDLVDLAGQEEAAVGREGHVAAVGRDVHALADARRQQAGGQDRDGQGRARHPIAHEGAQVVLAGVGGVDREPVGGRADEGHEAAVARDGGPQRLAVTLLTGRPHADQLGGLRQQVVHEDIGLVVAIAGDDVVVVALEGHEAAVRGDRGLVAAVDARAAPQPLAHERRRLGHPVVDVDVENRVRVAWIEVRSLGAERNQTTISRQLRSD